MRIRRLPLIACALSGLLAVGLVSLSHSSPIELATATLFGKTAAVATPAALTARPSQPPLPEIAEAERESRAAVAEQRCDSEIEEEAARPIQRVVQVDRGDTLMDLLLRAGVDRTEAHAAIAALREVYDPKSLKIGQEVTVSFERPAGGIGSGAFHGISLQPEADRQVSAKRESDGFAASQVKHETVRQLARFTGTIESSLFEAATTAGIPVQTLIEAVRAFSYDVDFQRDIQPGDRFEILVERYYDKQGRLVREGDLVYAGLNLSGNQLAIYRHVDAAGTADYYDGKGESVRKALLRTPVDGVKLSSGFGMRKHPILGYTKMHKGVDFAAPTGTPIYAAGDGTVEQAGANGSYGYYVRIRHSGEYSTAYAHLSRFAQGIRAGKQVRQGTVIGYVGSTGRSTGAHLHYELLAHGGQINPLSVKFATGKKLDGKELGRYMASLQQTAKTFAGLPESSKVASANGKTKAN